MKIGDHELDAKQEAVLVAMYHGIDTIGMLLRVILLPEEELRTILAELVQLKLIRSMADKGEVE